MLGLQMDYTQNLGLQNAYLGITFGITVGLQWDYKKNNRITKKMLGLYWDYSKSPSGITNGTVGIIFPYRRSIGHICSPEGSHIFEISYNHYITTHLKSQTVEGHTKKVTCTFFGH